MFTNEWSDVMYCLLGIALYSIYSAESTFLEALCVNTTHVIKLIRVTSESKTPNEFPVR